ncbi:DNA cytosine methyltransferase [Lysinibacillus sphaericus]|uniref:DNA (cytosine-5-)-methyltransferase n=1 Tax=Lysinibacillus sphaericus TaxID=1421 RepID=A0A6G9ZZK0_LYSSH|nr:DNA cytosine methyltransferase [Lysinibacillus sphaericus]QIS31202.1 hypothetical protein [Lysinibacillus sphaericus]QPA61250.1 DNA cytosine methyltransferase [Lysinibacillus sphaericus]
MFKKTKRIKKSHRGITFSDSEMFPIHSKYKYFIDKKNKKVIICLSDHDEALKKRLQVSIDTLPSYEGTVSRKKRSGDNFIPLVDIRNSEAIQQFDDFEQLQVSISDDLIVVEGITASGEQYVYAANKKQVFKHLDIVAEDKKAHIKVASFFAGSGIGDQGLKEAGFDIVFALENDMNAADTYRANHGDHITVQDIEDFDGSTLNGIEFAFGSPPCVDYTPANQKTNKWHNPEPTLIDEYIRVLKEMRDLKVWVLENSKLFLTAGNGNVIRDICTELPDFDISYGILDAVDYNSPQRRERTFIIGSKIGKIDLPSPITTPDNYKTVQEAFAGLSDNLPNQKDVTTPKATTKARMGFVPQGGNWRNIPRSLLPKGFGKNTHSSIYRRLELDKPSFAITNVRKSNILHPLYDRVVSIREAARLFDLPDNFVFKGPLRAMQQQVANGITVNVAKAVGQKILYAFKKVMYELTPKGTYLI